MQGNGDLAVNAGDLGPLDCLNICQGHLHQDAHLPPYRAFSPITTPTRQLVLVSGIATFPVSSTYVFDNHRK